MSISRVSPERQAAAQRAQTAAVVEAAPFAGHLLGADLPLILSLPPEYTIPIVLAELALFANAWSNLNRRRRLTDPSVRDDQVNLYRTPVHEFVYKKIFRRGQTS